MNDYELSKNDFELLDDIFRHYLRSGTQSIIDEHLARDLRERFRHAHTAKIIYE